MQTLRRRGARINSKETGYPIAHTRILVADAMMLQQPTERTLRQSYDLVDQNRDFLCPTLPWAKDYTLERALADYENITHDVKRGLLAPYHIFVDSRMVGSASLHSRDGSRMKLGYWLAELEQRKGYARKAAAVLVEYAFQKLGVSVVDLRIAPANLGSQDVAQTVGAEFTGAMESPSSQNGYRELQIWEIHKNGR